MEWSNDQKGVTKSCPVARSWTSTSAITMSTSPLILLECRDDYERLEIVRDLHAASVRLAEALALAEIEVAPCD